LTIDGLTLRNRVVMPPMVTNLDVATDYGWTWYAERARGGVGLIIVEATRLPRFEEVGFEAALAQLVDGVHAEGAAVAIQLFAPPEVHGQKVAVTASEGLRGITKEEIQGLIRAFVHAAKACEAAGFDGVEPHGAHGFFLNQFFSPRTNRRTDEYGGSLEGRMRLGLEVVHALREAVSPDFKLLYRHTPEEAGENGYPLADSQEFAVRLEEAGVDLLDISPSTSPTSGHAGLADAIKEVVDIPVIAVGGMNDPARAEAALAAGKCDLVAIGRGLIADPFWVQKVQAGREDELIRCVECNEGCFGNLQRGRPVECVQRSEAKP